MKFEIILHRGIDDEYWGARLLKWPLLIYHENWEVRLLHFRLYVIVAVGMNTSFGCIKNHIYLVYGCESAFSYRSCFGTSVSAVAAGCVFPVKVESQKTICNIQNDSLLECEKLPAIVSNNFMHFISFQWEYLRDSEHNFKLISYYSCKVNLQNIATSHPMQRFSLSHSRQAHTRIIAGRIVFFFYQNPWQ